MVTQRCCIAVEKQDSFLMKLAGKELRRYLWLLGEGLIEIRENVPDSGNCIVAAKADSQDEVPERGFVIQTKKEEGRTLILLKGWGDIEVLYAVYTYLEMLGIRFYMSGDVLPENTAKNLLFGEEINRVERPLFLVRGLHPFHDFPEGPDWWSQENYRQNLSQLVKMKGNFIGLHTYPETRKEPVKMTAEPLVWIGMEEDCGEDGAVRISYPAQHFKTSGDTWNYHAVPIGEYPFETGKVFSGEVMLPSYMKGYEEESYLKQLKWAELKPEEEIGRYTGMFQACGEFFSRVFHYAHLLDVKTCIGTEVPLTVPGIVKKHYGLEGSMTDEQLTAFYQGMFRRIQVLYELDYYWMWTPEDWTWRGNSQEETAETIRNFQCALEAKKKSNAAFELAVCGWTLGPLEDRAAFDRFLPKTMPFSCINRYVGFERVEETFRELTERPTWAIPWLEDDPAMISPQLWVGRVRKDAYDAKQYGCEGLLGIHWRTESVSPVIRAMLDAGWSQADWEESASAVIGSLVSREEEEEGRRKRVEGVPVDLPACNITGRYADSLDFYEDWCRAQFGEEAGKLAATIYAKMDGYLPRPSKWVDGPGNVTVNEEPWETVSREYEFVKELAELEPFVKTEDCMERFETRLAEWRYLRATAEVGCRKAAFDRACKSRNTEELERAASMLTKAVVELEKQLLLSVKSVGELGVLTNLQQRSLIPIKNECNEALAEMGLPAMEWNESPLEPCSKLVLLTERSNLLEQEPWEVKVLVLGGGATRVTIFWHSLEGGTKYKKDLVHEGGWRFGVLLNPEEISEDFAYHIEADGQKKLFYPVQGQYREKTVIIGG